MKVKLCGLRRSEDIKYVNLFLPDYIGFVFAKSKRQIDGETGARLKEMLGARIKAVGVFVNEDITEVVGIKNKVGLDVIQLHGDEDNSYIQSLKELLPNVEIWKAVRVRDEKMLCLANESLADKLLLDAFNKDVYGGSGDIANWDLIKSVEMQKPFFLAGGLNSSNIKNAIKQVKPYGVDISSGIENNGFKDEDKIRGIIRIISN